MRYIQAECTGKGFFTHEDRANFTLYGYGNIWVTDDYQAAIDWSMRINGIELTKQQAEDIVNINNSGDRITLP